MQGWLRCTAKAEINAVMHEVLMEMQKRQIAGEILDVGEVHYRAHELLHQRTYRRTPPSRQEILIQFQDKPYLSCQRESHFGKFWSSERQYEDASETDNFTQITDTFKEMLECVVDLIRFLRENSMERTRSLPLLQLHTATKGKHLMKARARFLHARRKIFSRSEICPDWFKRSEEIIEFTNGLLSLVRSVLSSRSDSSVVAYSQPETSTEAVERVLSMGEAALYDFVRNLQSDHEALIAEIRAE